MSAETLRKAAAIVRQRGLAKGTFEDAAGRVCAHRSLRMVNPGAGGATEMRADLRAVFRVIDSISILTWSDLPTTTAEDVAAAFERAAELVESELEAS